MSGLSLVMFLVIDTTRSGAEISDWVGIETIVAVVWLQAFLLCFHLWWDTIFQFPLSKSKVKRICKHFQFFELVYVTKFAEKVVMEFQRSKVCILNCKNAGNDWVFVFNRGFDEFNFILWVFQMIKFFEQFTVKTCMCVFVVEVLRHSVSAAFHILVTIGVVGEELQCLCDYIWFGILITLSSCIYCWVGKAVKTFAWSILNEAV